jgi:hypothetical protein
MHANRHPAAEIVSKLRLFRANNYIGPGIPLIAEMAKDRIRNKIRRLAVRK